MPLTNPHVISQLRQLVYYNLDCNLLRNALFCAGRLHAYEPRSSEAAYLLALCHLRLGQFKAAYDNSRNSGSRGTHLGCAYILAQSCLALERYSEGATALERSKSLWLMRNNWGKHTETRRQHLPDAAAVYCLQGKLWQAHSEHQKAIECYVEALKINPFMWDAFLGICDLGANIRVSGIFKMTPEMTSSMSNTSHDETPLGVLDESPPNALSQNNASMNQPPTNHDPFSISKNRLNGDVKVSGSSALFEKLNGIRNIVTPHGGAGGPDITVINTPIGSNGILDPDFFAGKGVGAEPPLAPGRKGRAVPTRTLDFDEEAPPKMHSSSMMRVKSRSKAESEDHDGITISRSSTVHSGAELKRTVSGKMAQTVTSRSDASAAPTDPGAPQRRSVRLFNQIRPQSGKFSSSMGNLGGKEGREPKKVKATGTKGRSANSLNVGRVVSGNRKHGDPMDVDSKEPRPPSNVQSGTTAANKAASTNEKVKELEGLQWLLDLFSKLGGGYFALSHFQCQEALRLYNNITPSQRETPWVLAQIGRAHFEQSSYPEAEKIFTRIRTIAPSRLDDMEYYSTVLWHLKNEVDLAYLAHELIELDRGSPQAWCAVGNSFSLQRDHDQALKCFKRATQLDPSFAYAFTLQGHEHIANEEYDKAMSAYRAAITVEHRHYNAWYGLGRVFEKQGKYDAAEHHYRTAASINPTNAVLVTCLGGVFEKQKNPRAALDQFSRACQLSEKSAMSRFRKARVLIALREPERALVELKVLKDIAPDEANVHFLLGTVYKALKEKGNAIRHFTMALNLDPKASHHIKETMEQLEDDSDDEDADM